ncbi:MAG: hypothetical protein ACK56I_13260, partial [bacterium]
LAGIEQRIQILVQRQLLRLGLAAIEGDHPHLQTNHRYETLGRRSIERSLVGEIEIPQVTRARPLDDRLGRGRECGFTGGGSLGPGGAKAS